MSVHTRSARPVPPLLEREHELDLIDAMITRASAGAGGALLIEGPPGVGKTRLLIGARSLAGERGIRVLEARGAVLEREFAFGVVRQLYEPVLAGLSAAGREQLLAGAAGLAAGLLGDVQAPPMVDRGDAIFSALHGLYWLTVNLADDGPVLVLIDDAHWADPASLRFLAYLSRRLDGIPVMLVATGRESDPEADALWHDLREEPAATVLKPGPLSASAVSEVVRSHLGAEADEEFCLACERATGGNPLFLHELLAALAAAGVVPTAEAASAVTEVGPPAIARFVLHRLERLGRPATVLAQAVAVLGGDAELGLAADAAGLDRQAARTAADRLVRAHVLASDHRLRFVHPIVQAAVYDDLLPGERAGRHLAAAELLDESGAPVERVAAHVIEAGPTGNQRWVKTLRGAAAKAAERGDPRGAATYLAQALQEAPGELRAQVLCDLGRMEVALRDFDAGHDHLLEVLGRSSAPELRTQAGTWLARAAIASGQSRSATEALEAIATELQNSSGVRALELEAEAVTLVRMELSLRHLIPEWLPRFADHAAGHPRFEPVAGIHVLAEQLAKAEPAASVGNAVAALLPTVSPGDPFVFGTGLDTLIMAEQYATAARWLELALEAAHSIGFGTRIANLYTERGLAGLGRGNIGEAQLDAKTALELAGTNHFYAPRVMAIAVQTATERGELDAATRLVQPHEKQMARERLFVDEFLTSLGNLRIARGELSEGLADLLRCEGLLATYGIRRPGDWRAGAVRALADLGQGERAQEVAREGLDGARQFGAPRALSRALRSAGYVTSGDQGLALLEAAVAVATPSEARLELAYALSDLGGRLIRERRRREGREVLRQALDAALSCGARALEARVRGELGAGGGRPPRLELTGVEALTPAERRVCELAAGELSNRQVAQKLFVTEKTVELHLTNAYRKLGIRSRFQLASVIPVRDQTE